MQFHDLYSGYEKLSTVLRELSWSSHLHIMSKTRTRKEREFYLQTAIRERYSVRELERAIAGGLFERSIVASPKLSTLLREMHPEGNRYEWSTPSQTNHAERARFHACP